MARHRRVDDVKHGRQGRGFSRAGWTSHQNEAVGPHGEVAHDGRKVQTAKRRHRRRDGAEHGADDAALPESVDSEAPKTFEAVRKIKLEVLLEFLFLLIGKNTVHEALGVVGRELWELG